MTTAAIVTAVAVPTSAATAMTKTATKLESKIATVQQVEVVKGHRGFWESAFSALFTLSYRTVFVWWAVAVWFPELGLTYWQLVLPIYAACLLIHSVKVFPVLPKGFKGYL